MTAPGIALRCLALDAAAVAATDTLSRGGVDSVLIKGAGLARRLDTQRLYSDVDLLVAPAAFDAAESALAAAGYRPKYPVDLIAEWGHWHERSWVIPGPVPFTLDLHRGFAGVDDPDELWRVVRAGAAPMDLAGGTVLVPDKACCALFAALHAASPGGSAKPAADLARALAVLPVEVWTAAAELAARCAAVPAFALALRLAPAGGTVLSRLDLPETYPALSWLLANRASPTAVALASLAELPRRRRLHRLARLLVPSADYMRLANPEARSGPGALLLAYVTRYGRHARALPGALRKLRTARRYDGG
ncbi:nucleotidyltransferase family protein [Micromonospora sp. NBC_01813]|uniref:nucleotidyltransferase family protein n=1 Tax=Micromonospora sp. NBC_01813 TaxID=2975988 RepID=UPI002DDB8179|nr:nucleotidyltransferase family protein [Micromonospora sp. NBC_01813]WSA11386.1 nucleotidyltransferase family protein [Micromonospora sp. NBC_01813]